MRQIRDVARNRQVADGTALNVAQDRLHGPDRRSPPRRP
jgi:hypothetical protein